MLNEKEKKLIYYILEAFADSLFWDEETNQIDYQPIRFNCQMFELNKLEEAKNIKTFHIFIGNVLNKMCK